MRFVALAALIAGCATGGDMPADGGNVDGTPSIDATVTAEDAGPDAPPDACVAIAETCNNQDEDCDGVVDNGFPLGTMCDGADSDMCMEGMVVCGATGDAACADFTGDLVETCNGMDDDCQNGPDDTFDVGVACTEGLGACARTGVKMCNSAQNGTVCTATAGTPTAELCGNSSDEDCNGADATCPGNDTAAGAIDITNGGTFSVDLTTAHDDNWAMSTVSFDCGNQGGRDVFYQFTLPAEEVVYWDTFGSNFDTVVRVFAGSCAGIGATLACSDDACTGTRSQGAANLAAGTYCLVVDQFSSNVTAGMSTLVFRRGRRSGLPIAASNGSQAGTTAGKVNQSQASCESNTNQPDVGYFFLSCPVRTYTVGASTCSGTAFDSVIYLRTGAANSGTDVRCSDDVTGCGTGLQSSFTGATVTGPNLHWLIVDGFGSSGNGNYTLTYTVQ